MYTGAFQSYSARGLKFTNLTPNDTHALREIFGYTLTTIEVIKGDVTTYNALLFTHIDKKNLLEKAVDRTFGATGALLTAPTVFLAGASAVIFSNPITGILAMPWGIAAGLGALSAGTAGIPIALDYLKDLINGDERLVALDFAKNSILLKEKGEYICFESELTFTKDKDDITKNIEKIRNSSLDNNENVNSKPKNN